MIKDTQELMRIYHTVLQDIERWDEKEPIEEFLAKILEKRLLVDRKEAESIASGILSGIVKYKEAKEALKENPDLLQEVTDKVDKNIQEEFVKEIIEIFESVERSVKDGR